jgi:putative PEP-CTERM system TPR-repeat lipoprotein
MTPRFAISSLTLATLLLAGCGSSRPADVIAKADALIADGKLGEANVALKDLVQDDPSNAAARARLAAIALANGDFDAADAELGRVERSRLQDAESQRVGWDVDLAFARYQEVLDGLDRSSALDDPTRQLLRGHALRGLGRRNEAAESYQVARQARPAWADPVVGLAELDVANGELSAAATRLDAFLEAHSTDPDALVARAKVHAQRGEFAEAAAAFARAVANAPPGWPPSRRWSAKYQQAEAHLRRNDIASAKGVYDELNKSVPGIAATRLLAARIALLEKRFDDGIEELQRLAQGSADNAAISLLLAQAQFAGGSREQGLTTLERLVARSPQNLDAVKLLARFRVEQGRPDRAIELLDALGPEAGNDPEIVALVSASRLQQGQPEQAIAALERVVTANPGNQAALLQLAAAKFSQGDTAGTLALLDRVPGAARGSQQARLRLLALLAQGKRADIEAAISQLAAQEPADVQSLAAAVDILVATGRQDLARRIATRLSQVAPQDPFMLLRVAQVAAIDRDWAAAESTLSRAIMVAPRNIDARVALAQVASARGDEARALAILEEARRTDPGAIAPQLLSAAAYFRRGNRSKGEAAITELLANAPQDGVAASAAGTMLASIGEVAGSVSRLKLAVDQRPSAENWLQLAAAQTLSKDLRGAHESLLRAVAARPDWSAAVAALVANEITSGDRDQAVRRASEFARQFSQSGDAQRLYGEALLAAGRADEAVTVTRRAFEIAPSSALAISHFRARQRAGVARPEATLIEWLARSPNDIAARALLAEAHMLAGSRSRAIDEYEDILARASSNLLALNNLAWLHLENGDLARAEQLGRKALELAPTSSAVLDTVGWILLKRNKTPEALSMLERAAIGAAGDPAIQYHYAAVLAASGQATKAKEVLRRTLESNVAFDKRAEAERLLRDLGA